MNKLVLLPFLFGAGALSTGCIIESNNNPPPPGRGTVTATWDLQDWNDQTRQAVAANCPAGADTAIVYSLLAGDTNAADATKDLFNCTDFTGTTAGLPEDAYTEWVEITDHSGAVLYAQSNSQQISVIGGTNTSVTFPFQVNRGYIAGAWTLQGASSHTNLSCADAQATGVEFDETGTGGALVPDMFDCAPGQGTTFPLPIDNYVFSAQALGGSPEGAIGPAFTKSNVKVQTGNQLVNVGSMVLLVDGL